MKKLTCLILCLATWIATPAFSQDKTPPGAPVAAPTLTKFELDFPGGTPNELVAAIQKAMGRPLNAIVPTEYASQKLPPLKMKGVDAAQLFQALERASQSVGVGGYMNHYSQTSVSFGFMTQGPLSDESVWYFYRRGEALYPRVSRFYLLTPYLDRGLTVDDITTAIQTGWKMLGYSTSAALSFHKETKLLIAVGDLDQLQTVTDVLKALDTPTAATKPESPKPESPKT